MLSLGVDMSERPVRAVLVDDDGALIARGAGAGAAQAARAAASARAPRRAGLAAFDATEKLVVKGVKFLQRCTPGAAAIAAQAWLGGARGVRHAICLHIGEEVYAGVMLDGVPCGGAHDRAGAAAWLALNPVERQDYRKLGSLAAEVSTGGITRRLSWRIQAGDHSQVLDAAGGSLDAITAQQVFDAARAGDGVAISVLRDTARYIGMAVANFAAVIDPEVVIVSGTVADADLMLEPVRHECARWLAPGAMKDLRVEFSTLGADEVALGAARLALIASR